jgi:hypothetical protein
VSDDGGKLLGMNMADYAKWDLEHPAQAVKGEFLLHFRTEFLLCDECGEQADAVHLIDDGEAINVKFSCPNHDFGNYTMDFERMLNPKEGFLTHVAEKNWGLRAMAALNERLEEIDRERMIEAGVLK